MQRSFLTPAFGAAFLCLGAVLAGAAPLNLYITTRGNDASSGALNSPLATPAGARDRIRSLRAAGRLPKDSVTVWLRGGIYPLRETLSFTERDDGGTVPITYAAYRGEAVTLDGGQEVSGWRPVVDRAILARLDPAAHGHVLQADLRAQGVTDFGELSRRGFGQTIVHAGLELFFGGVPMTLARWPNNGQWVTIAGSVGDQGADHFTYAGNRPARWTHAEDAWVHGYWSFDWADSYDKIQGIDTVHHQIRTAPHGDLLAYQPQHRWYALNLLEELDQPGEWYLDRGTGLLYFWPPSDIRKGRPTVSLASDLVILDHVSHVTLRGLTLQNCRGTAVTIRGGAHDRIEDCLIRNTGNDAVDIAGAVDTGVRGCEISGTGDSAVQMDGGDRRTLTPGRDFVTDCRIHNYSRWDRTYHPAVGVDGVGNRVTHNLIYDAPHNAILLGGNDHLIEYNEIHHVCLQTGDSGAFYMGRDWTMRGNMVRFNYFHDLGGAAGLLGTTDVVGVYLDDTAAGTTVYGNLFVRARHGVQIGGGRDDVVSNNVFVDCKPAVSLDARGLGWAAKSIAPGGDWGMQEKLAAMPTTQPPWSARYPHLTNLLRDDPAAPKYDVISNNIAFRCPGWLDILDGENARRGATIQGNLSDEDPQFVDAAHGDYRLKATSPALKRGFHPLPLSQIGPRRSIK